MPGELVRRDPATQVLVTRETALQGVWRALDLSATWWDIALQHLIDDGRIRAHVLVAPKRHPRYRRLLDGLKLLRDAGVAEPDGGAAGSLLTERSVRDTIAVSFGAAGQPDRQANLVDLETEFGSDLGSYVQGS